jgi:alpha-1,6-mannosyltransferase
MLESSFIKYHARSIILFFSLCFLTICFLFINVTNLNSIIIIFLLTSLIHYFFAVKKTDSTSLPLFWLTFFIPRIILLFSEPFLSNDVYRYIFDSELWLNGIIPYHLPPDAFLNSEFITSPIERINHPELSTLYLIFPEFIFVLSKNLALPIPVFYLVIEAAIVYTLLRKKNDLFPLLVGVCLHPLLIIETYHSNHFDFLFLYSVLIFYTFSQSKTTFYLSFIVSVLTKGISLLFISVRRHKLIFLVSAILLGFNIWIMSFSQSNGLTEYHASFSFNQPIFEFLHSYFIESYHDIHTVVPYSLFNKLITFILVTILSFFIYRNYLSESIYWGLFISICFIFGSSTIHPWYLLIFIYFSLQTNSKTLLFVTYTIFISYVVLIDFKLENHWELNPLYFLFIYSPFLVKLVTTIIQKRSKLI